VPAPNNIPTACELATGAGCNAFLGEQCRPTPNGLCVDPSSSQNDGTPGSERFTEGNEMEFAIEDPNDPGHYESMATLRTHGEVALIGVLQPEGGPNPRGLMMTGGTMRGIFVGSAAMARRLNAAIDVNGIEPLIGARYGFEQAKDAYAHAWGPESFAKTVIELG